jgi:hypothetical protein
VALCACGIRAAVVQGEIPSKRSSNKKRARYFVQRSAFADLLAKLSK